MVEEWKKIECYSNYSVSNLGKVRNDKTGKMLKPAKSGGAGRKTYYYVLLYKGSRASRKTISIHRLVAQAFMPNPDNKPEVNHIDGNGFNNCVSNLEWIEHKDNLMHAYKVLNKKVAIGEPFAKPIIRIEDGKVFNSITEAAQACRTHPSGISQCLNGGLHRHTAGGYHWRYANREEYNMCNDSVTT